VIVSSGGGSGGNNGGNNGNNGNNHHGPGSPNHHPKGEKLVAELHRKLNNDVCDDYSGDAGDYLSDDDDDGDEHDIEKNHGPQNPHHENGINNGNHLADIADGDNGDYGDYGGNGGNGDNINNCKGDYGDNINAGSHIQEFQAGDNHINQTVDNNNVATKNEAAGKNVGSSDDASLSPMRPEKARALLAQQPQQADAGKQATDTVTGADGDRNTFEYLSDRNTLIRFEYL
jgi:hypothetical protein